ncbi:helix-turn-helix domain-containing protein [Devosia sp. CN2-171]|uniref:helix-turn-helix domain-containing protein n=1 Tax=Devosia sp. CN2-171 TaxID=3400909 RepID=UPI003BF91A4C
MSAPGPDTAARIPDNAARILLVDHDAAGCDALIELLDASFIVAPEIVVANGGRRAVEQLRLARYDLLLADLATLADLASDAEHAMARLVRLAPGALVVALSDGGSVSATLAALQAGAHEHITRPVNGPALAARLGELALRHSRPIAGAFRGPADRERLAGLLDASNQLQTVLDFLARDLPGSAEHLEGVARRIVAMFEDSEAPAQPDAPAGMRPAVLPMWQQEQRIIEDAIDSFGGNIALAAQALELSPSTIYRKRQAWAEMEGTKGAA